MTRTHRRSHRNGSPVARPMVRAVVAGAAIVAMLAIAGCSAATEAPTPAATSATPIPAPSSTSTAAAPQPEAQAPSPPTVGIEPASISVPGIDLDESLISLGLQADGTMEVPSDFADVGWFTGGGRPGGVGPTVIAGHVDSLSGPAVFFRLSELEASDRFSVTGVDGTVFDYEVYRADDYAKSEFPTAEVFGAILSDEIRLITCGGVFDRDIGHYTDNRVVYAKRV